ncbi:hypothetical protein BDB01DRAFT_804543 [Pilobolus umbonatus]|nr:hypothetical protein BDB01DRAFT_804543 [Pilobolus umbonatus]
MDILLMLFYLLFSLFQFSIPPPTPSSNLMKYLLYSSLFVSLFLSTIALDIRSPVIHDDIHLSDYTHSHENINKATFTCVSLGDCEVCSPLEQKTVSYCMEYGNKEAIQCVWDDQEITDKKNQTEDNTLPLFRACPRVREVERIKFIRFEVFNVIVALVSVLIVFWRQRKIARQQYQRLAQRIGVLV